METFTMSRKELPRAGLVTAAVAGRISNREGAAALHMTPRQFQRLKQRFRETGAVGLRHQTRGRPSHRRLPAPLAAQAQALLRDRYAGFNDTHFTEKLREEHGLVISRESVRRLRRALGLPARHRRRPAQHRSRRLREAAAGQLLQLDGSPFDWLEARGPQAKGRLERLWGTLQDRLVSELRLRRITTRAAANAFLPEFLADFNPRFARTARAPQAVWRRPPRDLALIVGCRYRRVVAR